MKISINRTLIALCMSISMGIGSMEIDKFTSIAMETEKLSNNKRRLEDNPTPTPTEELFFKKPRKQQAVPAPLSAAVTPPSSPSIGYVNSAIFASPHHPWAQELCKAYNETANIVGKSLKRTSPEPHGSPCQSSHEAFEALLDNLESYDEKRRAKEATAIAKELKAHTFATVDELAQLLEAHSSKILEVTRPRAGFALTPSAITSSQTPAIVSPTDIIWRMLDDIEDISVNIDDQPKSHEYNNWVQRKLEILHNSRMQREAERKKKEDEKRMKTLVSEAPTGAKTMSEVELKCSASGVPNPTGARRMSGVEMQISASGDTR